MPNKRILILAGTNDARLLANRLVADGHVVVSSFAGVTQNPKLPEGQLRIGGFGGAEGLRHYLHDNKIEILIDATHPFACAISHNACVAWPNVLRLERPAWQRAVGANWTEVSNVAAAVNALPLHATAFLTIGRKEIAAFIARPELSGVARMIEAPEREMPSNWKLILQRPPFALEGELALMQGAKISHIVCKNAGGSETIEKLQAAQILGVQVIMISRPTKPPTRTFTSIDAIAAYISSR